MNSVVIQICDYTVVSPRILCSNSDDIARRDCEVESALLRVATKPSDIDVVEPDVASIIGRCGQDSV